MPPSKLCASAPLRETSSQDAVSENTLKLKNKRLGLLINFNENLIRDGITRIVNGLEE